MLFLRKESNIHSLAQRNHPARSQPQNASRSNPRSRSNLLRTTPLTDKTFPWSSTKWTAKAPWHPASVPNLRLARRWSPRPKWCTITRCSIDSRASSNACERTKTSTRFYCRSSRKTRTGRRSSYGGFRSASGSAWRRSISGTGICAASRPRVRGRWARMTARTSAALTASTLICITLR